MNKRLVLAMCLIIAAMSFAPLHARDALADTESATAIRWSPCPGQSGVDCGSIAVPLDYRRAHGPKITLALARHRATDAAHRRGVLLFNPGGPGESGVRTLPVVMAFLPSPITALFDLVGFDERGTGASNRIDCGTSPAAAASVIPVPAHPDRPLPSAGFFEDVAERCRRRYGALLGNINTMNAARDLDAIRAGLREERIDYLGLSYGTLLGAAYAELFPHRIRTMVLDGAVDPHTSLADAARQEAPAIEASLAHFFDTCRHDASCALYPHPRATYEEVKERLTNRPLPAPGNGDPYPVTVGDLDAATLLYLSVPNLFGSFPSAVQAAAQGDGTPLRQVSLTFFEDLDASSLVDPLWTITCEDQAVHPSPRSAGQLARDLDRRYPLIGAYAVTYNLGGCVSWPRSPMPLAHIRGAGAPPIVVIGNTGDPNTPHLWAERLSHTLASGVLVTWNGWGHTWLLNGSSDPCMADVVSTYFLRQTVPTNGRTCT